LWEADIKYVTHPIQCLDYITVSDLATWRTAKLTFIGPKDPYYNSEFEKIYGKDGSGVSSYICSAIGSDRQDNYFTPIGAFLAGLFSQFAWKYSAMRELDKYFRNVKMMGTGEGKLRNWPISIYSEEIRQQVFDGQLSNGKAYDEWSVCF
jgi:hypothetical protein